MNYNPVPTAEGNVPLNKGAAALEEAGKRFGGKWKLIFFTQGFCVVVGGVLSIISGIVSFESPWDFVNNAYLTLFGLLMVAMDFPVQYPLVLKVKKNVYHYAKFMTRFVGRGIWYLFLGSMVFGALFDNNVSPFIGFIIGGYMAVAACYCVFYGIQLTRRLEVVRKNVLAQGPDAWGSYIPPNGMTKVQFRELAVSLKGEHFSDEDLGYIVNAFSIEMHSDDIISKEEFEAWTKGGMLVL